MKTLLLIFSTHNNKTVKECFIDYIILIYDRESIEDELVCGLSDYKALFVPWTDGAKSLVTLHHTHSERRWPLSGASHADLQGLLLLLLLLLLLYIYCALINALTAHTIRVNLNTTFYTYVEQSLLMQYT